jgi:hypothetical protein
MTIASLGDIGYQTNSNVADAYSIPSTIAMASSALRDALRLGTPTLRDAVLRPRYQVTSGGTLSLLP